MRQSRRKVLKAGAALAAASTLPHFARAAETGPIKIGMSMPQTGSLGAGGQAALVALRLWVDDVNQRGGLLNRKVELIAYDDQTNPANTPGIYTNKTFFTRYFPSTFIPRYEHGQHAGQAIPLVFWVTSCGSHCGPDAIDHEPRRELHSSRHRRSGLWRKGP